MERKKYFYILIFCLLALNSTAQNHKSIYKAYISGDMAKWKKTIDSIEALPDKSNPVKLDLLNYQYGYIGWCISKNKKTEAEKFIKKSKELMRQLEQNKYSIAVLDAYKAAFIGFEIGMSPYKAPFIGKQSLTFAKKSVETDAQNTLGYVQLGNIAFYTPKTFGGNKSEAMQYYLKALKIMDSKNEQKKHNWNYLNLLATIINAYMEVGDYESARKYCVRTLAAEPEFDWVKNQLYPQVLKKLKP